MIKCKKHPKYTARRRSFNRCTGCLNYFLRKHDNSVVPPVLKYPTIKEVGRASKFRLAIWHEFLDQPGVSILRSNKADDMEKILDVLNRERQIMNRIEEKLNLLGGM